MFCFVDGIKSFDDKFMNLIKEGKNAEILSSIQNHLKKNLFDNNGTHLLHLLAKYNNTEVIEFFVKSKCKLDVEDSSGMTPMMIAVLHGNFEAANLLHHAHVEMLVKKLVARIMSQDDGPSELKNLKHHIKDLYMQDIVAKFRIKELSSNQIANILMKLRYRLIDVVRLHDSAITETYLQLHPYNRFYDLCMDHVVSTYDWHHVEVLINHQPKNERSSVLYLIDLLMDKIAKYHESNVGKNFLKKVFSFEAFNEDTLGYFEEALQYTSKKDVEVFLQYGFHTTAKTKWGEDILGSLYGNPFVEMSFFIKDEKIDVDKRYIDDNTALHFAANGSIVKRIELLLEKGADPNAVNSDGYTPLCIILSKLYLNPLSVKPLLIGGADVSIIDDHLIDSIFGTEARQFLPYNADAIRLLAAHFAIMEANGLAVDRLVEAYLNLNAESLRKYLEDCRHQINKLKTYTIRTIRYRTNAITVFTILTEKPEKIAHLIREEDLVLINESVDWTLLLPYYCDALKKRMKDIVKINNLRDRATFVTCQFMGIGDPHHLVVQNVVRYFRFKDLLIFE